MQNDKKESALLQQDGIKKETDLTINYINDSNTLEANNQVQKHDFETLCLNDFMHLDIPSPKMLFEPIIQAKSLTMVHALRGVGKSFFAMSLAYAIATGKKFLRWKAPKPSKVLYIDGEMPATMLQDRFRRISKSFEDNDDTFTSNIHILSVDLQVDAAIDIGSGYWQIEINNIIEKNGIEFVILDNVSSLTTVDELDAKAWLDIQKWLLYLRKQGIAVLLIHHSGKRGGQRGISKREDILDTVINLEVSATKSKSAKKSTDTEFSDVVDEEDIFGGRCRLKFEKNRSLSTKDISNFNIDLVDTPDGGIAWVDTYSIVKTLHEQGSSYRDIEKLTGLSKSTVGNILKNEAQ